VIRKEDVIDRIQEAFAATPYPGDAFLQGSFDGCEPCDEVGAFVGKRDWSNLDSAMLDNHYSALSFFSEGGFRFFLPAYLIADLRGELQTANPLFHLWHGFAVASAEVPAGSVIFRRESSAKTLLNPKRYGAMTWGDSARYRLSIFTREEAIAIVAYLNYKSERDTTGLDKPRIEAALQEFWLDRAKNAPARQMLEDHLKEEERFTAALQRKQEEKQ
jgi:hypothetical protein